jgi:long-chain acyl-CoA synthetase
MYFGYSCTSRKLPGSSANKQLTDEVLAEILRLIPLGLASLFPLSESTSAPTPILALLPASPSTSFPLLFLQLASSPATPLVVLPSPKFLNEALHSKLHTQPKLVVVHASIAEDVVEQVWEDCGHEVGILIVGDPAKEHHQVVADASKKGMVVKYWEEVWEGAEKSKKVMPGETSLSMR